VGIPRIILHIVLILTAAFTLLPVLLVVTSSFTHESDLFVSGYTYFPAQGFSFDAYREVFKNGTQLWHSYLVTITVTAIGTSAGLCCTLPLGYILTRKDFNLRRPLGFLVFFTMIFQPGLVPTYLMLVGWFHLLNNYIVLLLPGLCSGFLVLLSKGMMQSIPYEYIESAKLDGAGEVKIFTSIVLPISKAAVATVGLFIAIGCWNDWMTSYLYMDISHSHLFSLQYMLVQMQLDITFLANMATQNIGVAIGEQPPLYTARMALCVLVTVPIICVYPFVQKYFQKGLTVGTLKG